MLCTVHSTTIEKALHNLNPNLRFDHQLLTDQYGLGVELGQRTGIYWNDEHICNIDHGEVEEYSTYGQYESAIVPCTVFEAHQKLKDPRILTIEQWVSEDDQPFVGQLNETMGLELEKVVDLGDGIGDSKQAFLTRHFDPQKGKHYILVRIYFIQRQLPHLVERIGFRAILQRLINAKVPGITHQSFSDEIGYTINPDDPVERVEMMHDAH